MLDTQENSLHIDQTRKFALNHNYPIIVVLLFGVILGSFIFSNFGISWDEPNYYRYGETTWKAYADPLAGTFQLYVKQNPNGFHYGQPFFVVAYGVHALLSLIFPRALSIDIWHLTIFFSFLLGIFFFYKLAQLWVNTTTATISTLLFASQPVLFGLSWIDPKDTPFMVFFLGAVYFGLVFSDQADRVFRDRARPKQNEDIFPSQKSGINTKRRKIAFAISIFLCVLSLILVIGAGTIKKLIANTILSISIDHPVSFIDMIFIQFAHNAQNSALIHYANKVPIIYHRFLVLFLAITLLYLIFFIYFIILRKYFTSFENFLGDLIKDFTNYPQKNAFIFSFIGACVFLGFASATRVVGPFAALLVIWVWVINLKKKSIPLIVFYGLVSFIIFFICWPYLWQNTLGNLFHGVLRGVNFPDSHTVFFGGVKYSSLALPASYLPTLLAITLTEPAVILILLGVIVSVYRFINKEICRSEILVPFVWFFLPFFYVVITTPNLYNNYRQLLFIMPGAFLISALSIDFICKKMERKWINALVIVAILFPGFLADIQLHPYEYAYYNSFIGGVQGAAHYYDVDYWLTCYKDLAQQINADEKGRVKVYIDFAPQLIKYYANENIIVNTIDHIFYPRGSYFILPLKLEEELRFPKYPIAYSVKLDGVNLCVAKKRP